MHRALRQLVCTAGLVSILLGTDVAVASTGAGSSSRGRAPAVAAAAAPTSAEPAIEALAVAEQRRIVLPGHRLLGISPDGRLLAALDEEGDEDCLRVLELASLRTIACVGLAGLDGGIWQRSLAWSPRSDRVVIHERGIHRLRDSDLWVLEVASGELRDVTDDGFAGDVFSPAATAHPGPILVDRDPAWHPDGQSLVFTRTEIQGGVAGRTRPVRLDLSTGEVSPVGADGVGDTDGGEMHAAWSADGTRLVQSVEGASTDKDGLWASDADGGRPRRVMGPDPERGSPLLVGLSPGGEVALVSYPRAASRLMRPSFALVDLATGVETPLEVAQPDGGRADAILPAISPGGDVLVHVTRVDAGPGDPAHQLDARPLGGGEPRLVIADLPGLGTGGLGQTATWASDGTILLPGPSTLGMLVRVGHDAAPAPDAGDWEARLVTLAGAVPVVDEPAVGATTLVTVGGSRSLIVTGPPKETRRLCWWPVEDEASGLRGWVALEDGLALGITGTVPDDGGACWWPEEDAAG